MKAILMLEDGHSFIGETIGAQGERIGEIILNTAVVGYQEMLTDPANLGKILVLTYPLIGNYGCAAKFNESQKTWVAGLAIKEKSRIYSNWQAESSLEDFLKENNLLTISGIDTRTLAVHLRKKGQMQGIISTVCFEPKELLAKLAERRKETDQSFLPEISVSRPKYPGKAKSRQKKIAILDLGITSSIIKQLENLNFSIVLLPYNIAYKEILRLKPRGLIISNAPETDPGIQEVIPNVQGLIGKLPILGISTGHQIIARALGAKTVKMKIGHHGVNYPMYNPASYKAEITVQNHSYVIDASSLSKIRQVKITGYNLNDRTVEEIESRKLKLLGAQYYPQSPGFNEVNNIFKRFVKMLSKE